jgi:hypothetical protein
MSGIELAAGTGADPEFVVDPSWPLVAWTLLALVSVGAGVGVALKGRWGWFVAGLVVPLVWLHAATLPPAAGSVWARRRARRSGRSR